MFEVGVLCVIAVAVAYCATLWIIGRKDDVIFGQYVRTERFSHAKAKPPPASAGLDLILEALSTNGASTKPR
jgi:hypothetical protein